MNNLTFHYDGIFLIVNKTTYNNNKKLVASGNALKALKHGLVYFDNGDPYTLCKNDLKLISNRSRTNSTKRNVKFKDMTKVS